jgi:outer membrane protein OmpA-like peptidoglycan-associated protein
LPAPGSARWRAAARARSSAARWVRRAGAGAGALIGNYMDKQEKALKEVKGANVERQGDKLVVKFNSAILFDTGKSKLKPASKTT